MLGGGGGVLGGVLGGGAKAGADGKAGGKQASSLGLNGLTSGLLGGKGPVGGLLGGGAGGLLGGVLGGGGEGKKGALGLSGLTSGLLGGAGGGNLLGSVLGGGGKTADGKKVAGLGGLTSGLLNGGAGGILSGTLGGILGGGKSTGGKSSALGLNGLTSGLLGGAGGGNLLGGLLGGGGAKAEAAAAVESKFDVNVESEPEVLVRGEAAFKFYVKNLFEYKAGAKAGLQLDGDDTIYKIYGKGLNVNGALKTSAAWNFNELIDAKAEGRTELLATTVDGALGAVFTVQPAASDKADETFTFELLIDTTKLREQGWFNREGTTVAVEAVLRSYLKAQICDTDALSATCCLTDAANTVQGLVRWNNKIQCQAGTSAQIVGLAMHERQSSIGYTEAALTWDVRGLAEAKGICVLEAAVQAN